MTALYYHFSTFTLITKINQQVLWEHFKWDLLTGTNIRYPENTVFLKYIRPGK